MTRKPDPERDARLRKWLQHTANSSRDTADEMAAMLGGCDDPLHPWNEPGAFRDWQDFVDRVARPLVEAEDAPSPEEAEVAGQAAMKLYRTANPYFICVSLVMMDNRLKAATVPDDEAMVLQIAKAMAWESWIEVQHGHVTMDGLWASLQPEIQHNWLMEAGLILRVINRTLSLRNA